MEKRLLNDAGGSDYNLNSGNFPGFWARVFFFLLRILKLWNTTYAKFSHLTSLTFFLTSKCKLPTAFFSAFFAVKKSFCFPFNIVYQFVPIYREITKTMNYPIYCFLGTFSHQNSVLNLNSTKVFRARFDSGGPSKSHLSISLSCIHPQTSTNACNAENHTEQESDCISGFYCFNNRQHQKQWKEN